MLFFKVLLIRSFVFLSVRLCVEGNGLDGLQGVDCPLDRHLPRVSRAKSTGNIVIMSIPGSVGMADRSLALGRSSAQIRRR